MLVHAPTVSNFRTIVISLVPVRERAVSCAMAQDRGAAVAVDHLIRSLRTIPFDGYRSRDGDAP